MIELSDDEGCVDDSASKRRQHRLQRKQELAMEEEGVEYCEARDAANQPDAEGRIAVGGGDSEPTVYLSPHIARIIKPHQVRHISPSSS